MIVIKFIDLFHNGYCCTLTILIIYYTCIASCTVDIIISITVYTIPPPWFAVFRSYITDIHHNEVMQGDQEVYGRLNLCECLLKFYIIKRLKKSFVKSVERFLQGQ